MKKSEANAKLRSLRKTDTYEPTPPHILIDALNDSVHKTLGKIRQVKGKRLRSLIKGDVNTHGNKVGTKGLTGTHEHDSVHRQSGIRPRSKGGVAVIVSSNLHSPEGDELRFQSTKQAKSYLDGLKQKSKPDGPF